MSRIRQIESLLARYPIAAAALYPGLIALFMFVTAATWLDLAQRRGALADVADLLAQIEARSAAPTRGMEQSEVAAPPGSPFVEGATASVAGASLLQRISAAAAQVGGNIVSSQVELQGRQAKAGFVGVTANLELEPPALAQLLYDLEAGMPFVFVDQLTVQAPEKSANERGGKMRVMLSVSGQWGGAK
jgi:general secretion pathway protein M